MNPNNILNAVKAINPVKFLHDTYVQDPGSGRFAPQSPYWDVADANAIKDPTKRQQALNKVPLNMVAAGTVGDTPNIHPEDQAVMANFIDHVRLNKPANQQLELDAARLAEHHNLTMPKTANGLANVFDSVLSRIRQKH